MYFSTKMQSNLSFSLNYKHHTRSNLFSQISLKSEQLHIQNRYQINVGGGFFVSIKKVFGRRCLYSPAKHTTILPTRNSTYIGVRIYVLCKTKETGDDLNCMAKFYLLSIWVYIQVSRQVCCVVVQWTLCLRDPLTGLHSEPT